MLQWKNPRLVSLLTFLVLAATLLGKFNIGNWGWDNWGWN